MKSVRTIVLIFVLVIIICIAAPIFTYAEEAEIYSIEVLNDRIGDVITENIMIKDGEVFMKVDAICRQTGYEATRYADNHEESIYFSRGYKSVKVETKDKYISCHGVKEKLSDVIIKDGIWLPMEVTFHYLSARCDFVDGVIFVTSAERTVGEMIEAFQPVLESDLYNIDIYEQSGKPNWSIDIAVGASCFWDFIRDPVDTAFKRQEDLFADMVRADDNDAEAIFELIKTTNKSASYIKKMDGIAQKLDEPEYTVLISMAEAPTPTTFEKVAGAYKDISHYVDIGNVIDGIQYTRLAYDSCYIYVDALDYGFVNAKYRGEFKNDDILVAAGDAVEASNGNRTKLDDFIYIVNRGVVDKWKQNVIEGFGDYFVPGLSYVIDAYDILGEILGTNEMVDRFLDMYDLSKFQKINRATYFNVIKVMKSDYKNVNEETIRELKYSALLFLRTAMMYAEGVDVPSHVKTLRDNINAMLLFKDEDLLLDDLSFMSEYNIDAAQIKTELAKSGNQSENASTDDRNLMGMGNTSGNIANGGIAAECDGWIYYRSNDGGSIYKMRNDGSEETKLNNDNSWYINVLGDWVYYIVSDSEYSSGNGIVRMHKDGTERVVVLSGNFSNLIIADGWVYFLDSGRIVQMRSDGSEQQKLPAAEEGTVESFWVEGDTLVYENEWDTEDDYGYIAYLHISRMNLDGTNFSALDEETYRNGRGDWYYDLQITGDMVYYVFGGGADYWVHSVPINGGVEQIISPIKNMSHFCLNVHGDELYCFASNYIEKGSVLLHSNVDGRNPVRMCVDNAVLEELYNLCVAGNWVFYMHNGETEMVSRDTVMIAGIEDDDNDYLIPGSDSRYITEADFEGFDAWTACLARNEIFARHGYTFKTQKIQAYFDNMDWYLWNPAVYADNPPELNEFEEYNVGVIKEYEEKLLLGSSTFAFDELYIDSKFPYISFVEWDHDEWDFVFNEINKTEGGYLVECDFLETLETRTMFVSSNTPTHCIDNDSAWIEGNTDWYDHYTFEEFLEKGSDYGIFPYFFAVIEGDEIVEMIEAYAP